MLVRLRVKDLVLIEDLDLELGPGFHVLTGETGAGKSLVAAAVGLLLGWKAGSGAVRRGAREAEVEGLFDISDEPAVRERLRAAGLPSDDELVIRRVIPADGRQRAYVNGRLSSRAVLLSLAGDLASVASQREHHALLEPARQLALLDAYGDLEPELREMARLAARAAAARERWEALRAREQDRARRLDYLSFELREIEEIDPRPGELEELAREADRLRHREALLAAARGAADDLYEGEGSVFERLGARSRDLRSVARHDPSLEEDALRLEEAAELVAETARRLAGYGEGVEADPERLEEIEARRAALSDLLRKHGTDLEGLLARREEIAAEVADLSRYRESRERARREMDEARAEARDRAASLTAARKRAAAGLGRAVTAELRSLALGEARFSVRISSREGEPGPAGSDDVEFLVALNPGEGTHPLREAASGGELSRLMLAVRRALAGVGPVGTYVFDEVDAGIGGATAAAVGAKLAETARHHQVVAITHLPQIAGRAHVHHVVEKITRAGRTVTRVRRLSEEERVSEIARMLSGGASGEHSLAAARELLGAGRGKPKTREE